MNPVNPKAENLATGWESVVYAKDQPQYIPLPSLRELVPHPLVGGPDIPNRVVSVWEPDDTELAMMKACIEAGGRPRISLMSYVAGAPLQPIRMTVGDFSEPYRCGLAPLDIVDDRTDEQKLADGDTPKISDDDWQQAKNYFDEVKSQYLELLGAPGVAVGPALMLTFEPLERRFNSGERTAELYDEMRSVA